MLRRLLLALALSTALVSATTVPARAAPAVVAIGAFIATPIGGIIANVAIGFVASAAGQLIKQFFGPKSPGSAAAAGIRATVAEGGDVPISFIMGDRMTAGSLAYVGTWGSAGKTPNAYYVEERILSDLPMPNLTGIWVGDQKCTIDWEATPATQGYPVLEYRVSGKDHAWVRYHDGTQTSADSYMVAKFGGHASRPYTAGMIGRGQAKVIVTCLVNHDLFRSNPKLKFETDGIALYDISKDTTAGGDGSHRIDDSDTWEPSNLLPVHIYNALVGIRYEGTWLWGGQNISAGRLPAASWIAAISEARAAAALAGGGTEAQFRGGFEVMGNMEPQAVIKELLKGCAGRMAEIGGTYKMLCGVPSSSVFSFTDRDILVSREQGYDPYPALEETHNGIQATYPEPAAGWAYKDAPPRYSSTLEAEDQGRRLAIDVRYEVVNSGTQVQRLMKAAIEEARRFRRHGLALPPEASELEPLDVVSWTSEANSYTAKKFIITEMEDEPTYLATLALQEIDPADYDYDPATDELPWSVGELSTSRPEAQPVSDWAVAPYVHVDGAGTHRKPGIKMFWDGDQDDVRALLYEVRLAAIDELILSGEFATNFANGEGPTPAGTMLSAEDYEARGRYDPLSARKTEWSAWLPVTTPDVPDIDFPPIAPEMLGPELAADHGLLVGTGPGSLSVLIDNFQRDMDDLAGAVATMGMTANVIRTMLTARFDASAAAIFRESIVRAEETAALATDITEVLAQVNNVIADGYLRFDAVVDGGGALATITAKVKATAGSAFSEAAWILRAEANGLGGTDGFFGVMGSFYVFATPTSVPVLAFAVDGVTGRVRFNDWDSIATTIGGTPIIQMHGSTGFFSITVD